MCNANQAKKYQLSQTDLGRQGLQFLEALMQSKQENAIWWKACLTP